MSAVIDMRNIVQAENLRFEIRTEMSGQSIVVDRKPSSMYVPPAGDIRARFRDRMVYLLLGTKMIEMTTPVAVKVGLALSKNGSACMYHGDIVLLEIGGEEIHLLPSIAVQLGGVLIKKADRADDFQRANPTRRLS